VIIANNTIADYGRHAAINLQNNANQKSVFTNCVVANNIYLNSGSHGLNTTVTEANNVRVTSAEAVNLIVRYTSLSTFNDLRLTPFARSLLGKGSVLSNLFGIAFDGTTRPSTGWDVGAFQQTPEIPVVNPASGPAITKQPVGQTASAGTTITLSVTASGTPAPTYQWRRNGTALSGQTSATLTLTKLTASNSGTYTVVVKNEAGTATSEDAVVTVNAPPAITTQPKSQTAKATATVTFTAAASGTPAPTYQWRKNGATISGATSATLKLTKVTAAQAGSYTVVAKNAAGSVTSKAAVLTVEKAVVANPPVTPPADSGDDRSGSSEDDPIVAPDAGHFSNLSVRAAPGTASESLIVGFVLASGKKRILVRAVGPGLSSLSESELKTFPDPHLTLYAGDALTASNAGWDGSEIMRQAFAEVGAFPLQDKSTDAAILATLAPKAYTAVVSGTGKGVVLAEIYDADPTADPARRLINLSARAHVGKGDDTLIAGFVFGGRKPWKVLIRSVGPSLSKLGMTGVLSDPQLDLYRKNTRLEHNDNWGGSSTLSKTFTQVGAFALAGATSKDAAIITTLDPGAYTAVVSGVNATTGNALVEAYEVR
jgi:hypothetical protein